MLSNSKLGTSLQENVLTLLCYDDTHGKIIASLVEAELFEGEYRLIADKALEFWHIYRQAPRDHTPDLVEKILRDNTNPRRAELMTLILTSMYGTHEGLNRVYIMSQLTNFIRMQRLAFAIMESAEKIEKKHVTAVEDIERIWAEMLRTQTIGFDAGMRLGEVERLLAHLERQTSEFVSGIDVYDKFSVVPSRGTLGAMLGVAGEGKTWYLINVGKHNLMLGKRVLHLSLEFDAEDVVQRYLQNLYSITTRDIEKLQLTSLMTHNNGRLRDLGVYTVRPDFSFASNTIKEELETRVEVMGQMADNLIVKRFPPNRITTLDVMAYLDTLETTERFTPDLILFDAPYLYKIGKKERHEAIGEHVLDTRALCIERNVAGVMTNQIGRDGARASTRRMTDIGEAWSITQTCDRVDTLSKTQAEAHFGLARLFADKARKAHDKFETLITQSYDIGQFCINSMLMDANYKRILQDVEDDEGNDDENED